MPRPIRGRARPAGFSFSGQTLRLLSMIVMLVVIGITIQRSAPWGRAPAARELAVAPAENEVRQSGGPAVAVTVVKPAPGADVATQPPEKPVASPATDGSSSPGESAEQLGEPPAQTEAQVPPEDQSPRDLAPGQAAPEVDERAAAGAWPIDDRDPAEAAAFAHEIQTVADRETLVLGVELPAYYRLLKWLGSQSADELAAREPQPAVFQQLMQHPDKYRGKLVTTDLTVNRALSYEVTEENSAGVKKLYELWGWPTAGQGWLYVIVTPELPPGFPEGATFPSQTVRVTGYFFKLQGYQPANAKPYARPLIAPLVVGKISWHHYAPAANPAETTLSWIILAGGGAIVLGAIGYWALAARHKKQHRKPIDGGLSAEPHEPDEDQFESPYEDSYPRDQERDNFDWLREDH